MSSRRPFHTYKEKDIDTLIESGSYLGGGIQDALDAGFNKVVSYEVSPGLHEKCKQRFGHDGRVDLHFRPSQSMRSELENLRGSRLMFWLDAHYSHPGTGYHRTTCPLLEELEIIRTCHDRNDHIIMIDDVRLLGTREFSGVTLKEVMEALLNINPEYVLEFANGHVPDDILIARIITKDPPTDPVATCLRDH